MFSIRTKIILSLLLLSLGSVGIAAGWLYRRAEQSLDQDLGQRLVTVAQAATAQFDGSIIAHVLPNDQSRTYLSIRRNLIQLQEATKVARVYLFDQDRRSLADTQPGVKPGNEYLKLRFDRFELEQVWEGHAIASVRFTGVDGNEYKSGYAPIQYEGKVVAVLGVDMSAEFLNTLHAWQRQFWLLLLGITVCTLFLGILLARRMTIPVRRLVAAARRIGEGDLETPIVLQTRDELGYLSHTMDEMRQSIVARDAQLKLMLANVAHEIRNPLGGIELFAGLVAEDLPADASAQEYLSRIRTEARNLNRIITEFLEFARPQPHHAEDVNLQNLLEDISFLILGDLQKQVIQYEQAVANALLHVDVEQVRRALLNVFRNAIQAMPEGGTLTIEGQPEGNELRLSVHDTGMGIAKENQEKLFDPFFTTKEKGAGLGLAIVKRNIEQNGGRIAITSEAGQGTTVMIWLPQAQAGDANV